MTHRLQHQKIDKARRRSYVVRHGPCFDSQAEQEKRSGNKRKAHFPVAPEPRESQQRDCEQRSAIELPRTHYLVPCEAGGAAQGAVFLEAVSYTHLTLPTSDL